MPIKKKPGGSKASVPGIIRSMECGVGSSYASCQKILKNKGYTYDSAASFGTIYCYTRKKSGQSIHLKTENGLCESITYLPKG